MILINKLQESFESQKVINHLAEVIQDKLAEGIANFWSMNYKVPGSILYKKKNPYKLNIEQNGFKYIDVDNYDLFYGSLRNEKYDIWFSKALAFFIKDSFLSKEEIAFIRKLMEFAMGMSITVKFRLNYHASSAGHFNGTKREIVLFLEDSQYKDVSLLKKSEVKKLISVRTLVHELAHFYDYCVSKGKDIGKKYVDLDDDIDLYAGQQIEMNARFYDGVNYALPWKYNVSSPLNYKEFAERIKSRVLWGKYDPAQKKSFLKRIYTEYTTLSPLEEDIVTYHNLSISLLQLDSPKQTNPYPEAVDSRISSKQFFSKLKEVLTQLANKKISVKLFHHDFQKQKRTLDKNEEENRTHYEKMRREEEIIRFFPRLYNKLKHWPVDFLSKAFKVSPDLINKIIEAYEIKQEVYI